MTERFWAKVQQGSADECWPWTGYIGPSGHGRTQYKYTSIIASRKAWILTHGEIRAELSVLHRCDNCLCCNPSHLYLGTRSDNMIDRWAKTPPMERGMRTHRSVLSPTNVEEIVDMRAKGFTLQECAAKFRVHYQTIRRRLLERKQQREKASTSK